MRKFIFALLPLLTGSLLVAAERLDPVSVGFSLDAGSYIIGEEIFANVLVKNNTAQKLTLGSKTSPSAVFTVVRTTDASKAPLSADPMGVLPTPLELEPNQQRTFAINLTQAVDIHHEGKFFVTFGAILDRTCYNTQARSVDIVPGYIVAEGTQLFANDPNRQRHIKLVRWSRDHIDRLFIRVEDNPGDKWFPTVMLGSYLSLVRPRLNIAPSGEVTVLHRATPEYYVRNVFWSLPKDFVHRTRINLLDPGTADTERLNGLRDDLDEIIQKNDKIKEAIRLK